MRMPGKVLRVEGKGCLRVYGIGFKVFRVWGIGLRMLGI